MADQDSTLIADAIEKQGTTASALRYLRRRQAAQYLRERGIPGTEKSLAKLATLGGGPTYRLFGRIPLYTPADLDQYIVGKLGKPVCSTSEYGDAR
jgi:hypothetical protein